MVACHRARHSLACPIFSHSPCSNLAESKLGTNAQKKSLMILFPLRYRLALSRILRSGRADGCTVGGEGGDVISTTSSASGRVGALVTFLSCCDLSLGEEKRGHPMMRRTEHGME